MPADISNMAVLLGRRNAPLVYTLELLLPSSNPTAAPTSSVAPPLVSWSPPCPRSPAWPLTWLRWLNGFQIGGQYSNCNTALVHKDVSAITWHCLVGSDVLLKGKGDWVRQARGYVILCEGEVKMAGDQEVGVCGITVDAAGPPT